MEKMELIKSYSRSLNLGWLTQNLENVLTKAQKNQDTLMSYTLNLLESEVKHRAEKDLQRRIKMAKLPLKHDLKNYENTFDNGISIQQIQQLKELLWLEQNFNIVLMGPSGTGKTFIAAGLCHLAILNGYKAYFRTIQQIAQTLKLKDITRNDKAEFNRLQKANLIVIDDIMLLPFEKNIAIGFFNFINELYEKTAFIITTNKAPRQWTELIGDTVLTTALLDRLLFHCQVIKLSGESYRMKNRKTIFEK